MGAQQHTAQRHGALYNDDPFGRWRVLRSRADDRAPGRCGDGRDGVAILGGPALYLAGNALFKAKRYDQLHRFQLPRNRGR